MRLLLVLQRGVVEVEDGVPLPDEGAVEAGYSMSRTAEEPIKMFGSIEEFDQEPVTVGPPGEVPIDPSNQIARASKEQEMNKPEEKFLAPPSGLPVAFLPTSWYQAPAVPETKEESRSAPTGLKEPAFVGEQALVRVDVVPANQATPLFRAVTNKNWQGVLYYLRTGSFRFSPLSSPDKESIARQAQTWVAKKDEMENELWRQLPLHAATPPMLPRRR